MKRRISATSQIKLQRVPCLTHQSGEPESRASAPPTPHPSLSAPPLPCSLLLSSWKPASRLQIRGIWLSCPAAAFYGRGEVHSEAPGGWGAGRRSKDWEEAPTCSSGPSWVRSGWGGGSESVGTAIHASEF